MQIETMRRAIDQRRSKGAYRTARCTCRDRDLDGLVSRQGVNATAGK